MLVHTLMLSPLLIAVQCSHVDKITIAQQIYWGRHQVAFADNVLESGDILSI